MFDGLSVVSDADAAEGFAGFDVPEKPNPSSDTPLAAGGGASSFSFISSASPPSGETGALSTASPSSAFSFLNSGATQSPPTDDRQSPHHCRC